MLVLLWVLLFLAGACLILLMPGIWGKQIYNTYRDPRPVNCPETHAPVSVRFNALRAAITGLNGHPNLQLRDCTRWPERADCGQECIPEAERNAPVTTTTLDRQPRMRIPYLPVLMAAAVAWVLGMAWHSEYLFRSKWMVALNLSDRQTRDLVELWSPHLISVAACLLFAYGVAWVINWLGPRTVLLGIRVSVSLWLVLAAAIMVATRSTLPHELLWIEGPYTFLAALLAGGIIGGVPRRGFLKETE
jgi:hypothetical protein